MRNLWGQPETLCAVVMAAVLLLPLAAFAQNQQTDEHTGQNPPPATAPSSNSPGEKPKQLAQPNGPPQADPNQKLQPKAVPGAAGVPVAPKTIEDQVPPASAPANWVTPLRMYEGTWVVKTEHSDHPQTITDTCQTSGLRFYECEHVIDGETIALLIFVPGDEPNHYYTQTVLPSGTALGRGDLLVQGDTWVFNTRTVRDNGAVDYERTTRVYSGHDKDTIHYQLERSDDGLHWETTNTGVEKRQK